MNSTRFQLAIVVMLALGLVVVSGCRSSKIQPTSERQSNAQPDVLKLRSPGVPFDGQVRRPRLVEGASIAASAFAPPMTVATQTLPEERWNISLDEAISIAMQNADVLRSLGAQVLRAPESTSAVFDPAIQASDPVFGVDAALAQFDTLLNGGLSYANNDRVFNNAIVGGGANELQQDLAIGTLGLQKFGRAGTRYSLRSNVQYDDNTRPTNLFESAYTTLMEAELRQPLLQGRGETFNQIAGPNAQPGFRNTSGVLIGRINNDISIAQFEQNAREFVNEVVNAYWQLYLAYKNYDAIEESLGAAEETYKIVKARYNNDLPGGEADKEAQAREQVYLFKSQLAAALGGDGSVGATGILQSEANLRRLMNLGQSDGLLLHPRESPSLASVVYDWQSLVSLAFHERVELREQSWEIKRRELELLASRQFLKPRLDAVATYRNNGFGDTLAGSGNSRFDSALQLAADRDYDEWEVGLQLNVPVGFRQANAAVRNGQLQLQRSRAILSEQQSQIAHDLGSAVRQADQSQLALDLATKRLDAAKQTVDAREAAFEADAVAFDELLDAQRNLADARVAYESAAVNAAIAHESVSRESGQLLGQHGVMMEQFPLSVYERAKSCSTGGSSDSIDYRWIR